MASFATGKATRKRIERYNCGPNIMPFLVIDTLVQAQQMHIHVPTTLASYCVRNTHSTFLTSHTCKPFLRLRKENGVGGLSPHCFSKKVYFIVLPSIRGGVPINKSVKKHFIKVFKDV